MDSEQGDLSSILGNISSYSGDAFYDFVNEFVGVIESKILEIQRIKNVRVLLQIPDVFSFIQLNCKDTFNLKQNAGIKYNIERFIDLLRKHHAWKSININSVASQIISNENKRTNQCVCDLFNINKKTKNMRRANNNYQFDPLVTKFASVFNILAGHNAYEFIRINLPGALPSTMG
jgi:hypothetical protein